MDCRHGHSIRYAIILHTIIFVDILLKKRAQSTWLLQKVVHKMHINMLQIGSYKLERNAFNET
jgi:hypothetical protein